MVYTSGFYLYGPAVNGKLVLIDDHEYFLLLGPTQELPIIEIVPRLLSLTELGHWGESMRFRPFYFIERALESSLWGIEPLPRFVLRIFLGSSLAACFAFLTWSELRNISIRMPQRVLVFFLSFFIGFLTLMISSWSDIILRLGPSEIFVAFALVPFILGVRRVWKNSSASAGWLWLFCGYAIAILSKENTFSLLPIIWIIAAISFKSSRVKFLILAGILFVTGLTIWIELGIYIAMAQNGGDVYGQQRNISDFLTKLFQEPYIYLAVIALVVAFVSEVKNLHKLNSSRVESHLAAARPFARFKFTLAVSASIWVLIFDTFIYQAAAEPRYLFLSQISLVVIFITSIIALITFNETRQTLSLVLALLLTFLAIGISNKGSSISRIQDLSTRASTNSQEVNSHIQELLEATKEFPNSRVVLYLNSPLLEHSFAISRIVWFATGNYVYFGKPYPELQTGSQGLLFETKIFITSENQNPICVFFGKTLDTESTNCETEIIF